MNENFAEDEVIGRLIREEGLLSTSTGFTDRVMQLLESSAQKKEETFKPLIDRKTWMIIATAIASLLLVSIIVSATGNSGQLAYINKLNSIVDDLTISHSLLRINTGIGMLVTLLLAIISLLLFLDLLLNTLFHGQLKQKSR